MTRTILACLALSLVTLAGGRAADAHCEVPCGIYTDQLRFESMLEDAKTIHRAMDQIGELAKQDGALAANQLVRWVNTKEEHASKTQHVIAQYFMTQRIKPGSDGYVAKLTAAHAVMQQAMKCKQTTDAAEADALREKILAFHKAYEGKK
jgi:nickel superoxide dismutase